MSDEVNVEFFPFPKIPRLVRDVVITEKLDGTNASVHWNDEMTEMRVASRSRWIKVGDDNFGFAAWAEKNREVLRELGPGAHFGEWWGKGIQRGYGLTEKRFSLFNAARWGVARPACCHVVPTLYAGPFRTSVCDELIAMLRDKGSAAVDGWKPAEGIVVFHSAAYVLFKQTIEKDGEPKGKHV
jgi:RNA ligase